MELVRVAAFTEDVRGGNPAAVCLLRKAWPDARLATLARAVNLPATAFLRQTGGGWELRWFAPSGELELCGHGTLAAAHVLWELARVPPDSSIAFATRAGPLAAERQAGFIELDFPVELASTAPAPPTLEQALGVTARHVARNRLDWLVELDTVSAVRGLSPDFARLREIPSRGVIVTARSDVEGADFVSRFFAPRVGIDEDAVTGSAHCCLGPYWGPRLGKGTLIGRQLSSRGGTVRVRLLGGRARLGGQAVTVGRGEPA
jgi:PhzF family phenazine biosynthesis protein